MTTKEFKSKYGEEILEFITTTIEENGLEYSLHKYKEILNENKKLKTNKIEFLEDCVEIIPSISLSTK